MQPPPPPDTAPPSKGMTLRSQSMGPFALQSQHLRQSGQYLQKSTTCPATAQASWWQRPCESLHESLQDRGPNRSCTVEIRKASTVQARELSGVSFLVDFCIAISRWIVAKACYSRKRRNYSALKLVLKIVPCIQVQVSHLPTSRSSTVCKLRTCPASRGYRAARPPAKSYLRVHRRTGGWIYVRAFRAFG